VWNPSKPMRILVVKIHIPKTHTHRQHSSHLRFQSPTPSTHRTGNTAAACSGNRYLTGFLMSSQGVFVGF
jgi:hypothetical protein